MLTATLAVGYAQSSSTTAPASGKAEPAPVVLSPFTVSSDRDSGYQAGNTLAGSRLNTKLSETPASVSVFTEEFLKDLGATGLAQVLEYGVNANVDFNTNSTAASFLFFDGGLLNDVRINNRGLFGSRTVDFLETTLPIDIYNTGRFDVSSGPNSVLFGFGAAGGIINAQIRQVNLARSSLNFTGTVGSWNGRRAEADINVMAVKDRFGIRLMGMHDESDSWRRYAGNKKDRWTLAATFKPFKTTTISAVYERGELMDRVTRPFNRQDGLSFWWRQGRPTVDNTSFGTNASAVQSPFGVRGIGFRNTFVSNTGSSFISRDAANGGNANTIIYRSASIYENGVVSGLDPRRQESGNLLTLLPTEARADGLPYAPYDVSYYGPEPIRKNHIDRKFVRVEQQLGKDGFLELAFNREAGSGFANELSGDFALYGDPNQFLPNPDGTATRVPNPNAGKLYTEHAWFFNSDTTTNQALRATASWKLDLGRFGEHRFASMAERSENTSTVYFGPDMLVNATTGVPLFNAAAPEAGTNTLWRRNYVTTGAPETYIPGSRLDSRPISFGGVSYKNRLVNSSATSTERDIDSLMLATHSKFFKGRLIVTGGIRRDQVDIIPRLQGRLSATDPRVISGERLVNEFDLVGVDTAIAKSFSFNTYTAGSVLALSKWLSVFYNQSNNNGAPQAVRRILPDASLPIPPEGTGRDWGAMFSFLDGRVFARATMFNTASKHDPSVRDGTFINAHRRILNAFRDNGLINQAEVDAHALTAYLGDFLSDLDSRGFEFELKANPTKNWTMTAAYSYTLFKRSNLGQEWYPWFAAQKAYYAKYPSTVVTSQGNTITREVDLIETGVENLFALNRLGYNNRAHKANVFTRYSFDQGLLKGFFIGGGVRWQSRNIMQRELVGFDPLNKDVVGKVLYGPAIFNVDGLMGYATSFKSGPLNRGTTMRVQLNVQNLLDNQTPQVVRLNRVGDGYWRVVSRDPRTFRLSVALGF